MALTKSDNSSILTDAFVSSWDFRTCLKAGLKHLYRKQGKPNLSDFSRRAGFASRSFISEVLKGKKGLSRDALERIVHALMLPKEYSDILECFALIEYPHLEYGRRVRKNHSDHLEVLKNKLQASERSKSSGESKAVSPNLIQKINYYKVFASLGSIEHGATIPEIKARSGLAEQPILELLDLMMQSELIYKNSDRYFVVAINIDKFGLGLQQGLSGLVTEVCSNLRNNRRNIIESPVDNIIFTTFSSRSERLAEFRTKLKSAIFDVIDEFQDDMGDNIRQVFLVNTDRL
jgi:hypothetical protein